LNFRQRRVGQTPGIDVFFNVFLMVSVILGGC
jgi:hypothetical protein